MGRKIESVREMPENLPSVREMRHMLAGRSRRGQRFYANDFSVLNPTIWAQEAVAQLLPNMVVGNLVSRDLNRQVSKFGDIVNAYIPGTYEMTRKGAPCDNIVIQDSSGSSVQVSLNQWPQVSFQICDGEEDRSMLDLIETNLTPAITALALGVDRILGVQMYQFLENNAGHLNNLDETNIKRYILEARETMNRLNVPLRGRTMLIGPGTETEALALDAFTDASKVGDDGTALREAALGRKYGFDFIMTQTQPEISTGQTAITAAVNNAGGYAAGVTVLTMDTVAGGTPAAGQWAVIDGDDTPQHVTASNGTTSLTITPGLKRAVADNAVIRIVKPGAVNNAAGYAGTTTNPRVIGWAKEILVDGFANSPPQLGQLVSFGTQTHRYAITKLRIINAGAGTFGIELDTPLNTAIVDDMTVNLGPAGKYNFALLRNAFVMLVSAIPSPRAGTGAIARTVTDAINKVSIRVTIAYDKDIQAHVVTLDFFMGVGTLSNDLGLVMLG
jgi:hypothetical protein